MKLVALPEFLVMNFNVITANVFHVRLPLLAFLIFLPFIYMYIYFQFLGFVMAIWTAVV